MENQSIRSGFDAIEKQSKYIFFYDDALRPLLTKRVTLSISSASIQAVMNRLLESSGLTYRIVDKQILISTTNVNNSPQEEKKKGITVTGKVTDENGLPLPGVNVYVLSLQRITTTNMEGEYSLLITPPAEPVLLQFSFVGMKTVEILIGEKEGTLVKNVQLFPDGQLEEVVVTGIFDRKAESFSGASTTISSKDLMRVGNQNLIESLKALDPTLYVPDNFTMGSDPNSLPTLSMRGTSSFPLTETSTLKSNYQNQPNQPLIILDGFESSIEYMVDMDMNRVESVTILKDASAKALYGSKAANGVIVIETKRLSGNEQRVSYNGSASFELPDLTSYDLTNALEKL
ncbi:MAG: TonB-dependent receptor plug domain-containing protein, partial [Proteiniphilum sp.]|nr:TonB-dependent receptor plug domain-containing protein [Proteiniphilum sp.]